MIINHGDSYGDWAAREPAPVRMKGKPINKWGHRPWCPGAKDPAKEEFGSYPEDGQCPCKLVKHHVHCSCGGIVQIG